MILEINMVREKCIANRDIALQTCQLIILEKQNNNTNTNIPNQSHCGDDGLSLKGNISSTLTKIKDILAISALYDCTEIICHDWLIMVRFNNVFNYKQ